MMTLGDVLQEITDVVGIYALRTGLVTMVVPDIHGELGLARVAADLALSSPGRTIWLGDVIDRGSASIEVVDLLCDVQDRRSDNIWISGNHERMLLDALEGDEIPTGPGWEDGELEESYCIVAYNRRYNGRIPPRHLRWFRSLQPFAEGAHALYCHGGMDHPRWVDTPPSQIPPAILMWSYSVHPRWNGKRIVRGHMPTGSVPIESKLSIDLETEFRHTTPQALHIGIIDDRPGRIHRLLGYVRIDRETLKMRLRWNPLADFSRRKQ